MTSTALRTAAGRLAPAVLLIVALLAAPAQARVPRTFFGVEADPLSPSGGAMSRADFARLRSARVGTMRVTFNWGLLEPTPGAQADWSSYDAEVGRAARAGISLVAVLVGSPGWAADASAHAPETAAGRAAFRRFVVEVVRRYGHRGRFWREHPNLPRRPPAYQVWNEPNYPPHWASEGLPTARQYASLLLPTARAIHRTDRRATVATAGLLASSSRGPAGYRFLSNLYAVPGFRRAVDAVAIHPYAEDTPGVEGELTRIRTVMRRNGDRRKPIWITELGWATGGGNQYFTMTPQAQAAHLGSAWRYVLRQRRRFGVSRLVWFSFRDRTAPGSEPLPWAFYCGLFYLDGRAKPAWATLRRIARAAG
jgi:hypothetical protein